MSGEKYTVLLDEDDAPNTIAAGLFDSYDEADQYAHRHWINEPEFDGTARVIQIEPTWGQDGGA